MSVPRVLLVLALIAALVAQSLGSAGAAPAVSACATHATSFAVGTIDEGSTELRMGCARDSGSLRSLASSDDDLVLAVPCRRG